MYSMRTREMKLSDYGLDKAQVNILLKKAKKKENRTLVENAATASNSFLSQYIVKSLVADTFKDGRSKVGYRTLFKSYFLPCTEDDFYAYRRKALYIFKILLRGRETENMSGEKDMTL